VARIRHATGRKKRVDLIAFAGSFHYFITCSRSDPFWNASRYTSALFYSERAKDVMYRKGARGKKARNAPRAEVRDDSDPRSIPSDRLFIGSVNSKRVAPPPSLISLFDCNSTLRPTQPEAPRRKRNKRFYPLRLSPPLSSLVPVPGDPAHATGIRAHPTHTRHAAHVQRCRCTADRSVTHVRYAPKIGHATGSRTCTVHVNVKFVRNLNRDLSPRAVDVHHRAGYQEEEEAPVACESPDR